MVDILKEALDGIWVLYSLCLNSDASKYSLLSLLKYRWNTYEYERRLLFLWAALAWHHNEKLRAVSNKILNISIYKTHAQRYTVIRMLTTLSLVVHIEYISERAHTRTHQPATRTHQPSTRTQTFTPAHALHNALNACHLHVGLAALRGKQGLAAPRGPCRVPQLVVVWCHGYCYALICSIYLRDMRHCEVIIMLQSSIAVDFFSNTKLWKNYNC